MQNYVTAKLLFSLLKKRPSLSQLNQIHAKIIIDALSSNASLMDSLIHCHLHIDNLTTARALFSHYPLPSPPIIVWNIMIRAYSKLQNSLKPFNLFSQLITFAHPSFWVFPDKYTFTFLITSCARQISISYGKIVHGMVLKNGYESNLYVGNSLVNFYAVFAKMKDAHKVFDAMCQRDVFSWTSLLCGYTKNGEMNRACETFREMPVRNDVSWAVIISGFVGSGRYLEALKYFREMLVYDECEVRPNEAVLVCVLSACAHTGALDQGNWIHVYIDKNGILVSSNISTALIDMYAKCGRIDFATRVFDEVRRPDVHNFTSLITGLSAHGLGRDALYIFNQMLAENIKPNKVTVLGVRNGCSHAGLVEEGSSVFAKMEKHWGIVPKIEHYGCYVDLLSRAGFLEKAFGIVKSMEMNPDIVIWRALLSACRIHRNIDLGEHILDHIKQLDTYGQSGGEVLLSNLYASLGRHERVVQVRKLMGHKKNHVEVGCSWIEVNGLVHEFRVADQLHAQIVEIRNKLHEILERASVVGYIVNTTQVSFDLSEEEKEQAVAWHSEKLAIAFGLMTTMPRTCIRIVKNLRTCEDCHSAMKAISKVYGREIIVRNRSRFHNFRDGNCSCADYW